MHLIRTVQVKIKLFTYLADIPERHTIFSLTRGNCNYTLRWGYLSDMRHLTSFFPDCEKCLKKMVAGTMVTSIKCKNA